MFASHPSDIVASGVPVKTWLPILPLGVALLIALGFGLVESFHDTAAAVARPIHTPSTSQAAAAVIASKAVGSIVSTAIRGAAASAFLGTENQ